MNTAFCKHKKNSTDPACAFCQDKYDEHAWAVSFAVYVHEYWLERKNHVSDIASLRKELEAARRVVETVRKMKAEALIYERWYTFVTCEFGEEVDDALAAYDAAKGK